MFTQNRVSTWLSGFGALALIAAFQPYMQHKGGGLADAAAVEHLIANPDDMPFTEDLRLGWDFSPFYEYHSESKLVRPNGEAFQSVRTKTWSVGWLSWSSFSLVVAVLLLWAGWKTQPRAVIDAPDTPH